MTKKNTMPEKSTQSTFLIGLIKKNAYPVNNYL